MATETWYRAWMWQIYEVQVERETESTVVIDGRRRNKNGDGQWFRKSRDEAKAMMVADLERQAEEMRERLKFIEETLEKAKAA